MKMFRAVPIEQVTKAHEQVYRRSTIRLPSNIPYGVDNLWELIRPDAMPSRRFAIYASPTPELALANASAGHKTRDEYVACEVIVNRDDISVAHLVVSDARYHPDIKMFSRLVSKYADDLSPTSLNEQMRQKAGLLWMPGAFPNEIYNLLDIPVIRKLVAEFKEASTFWQDASNAPCSSDGEMFFELRHPTSFYTLRPLL
ncbi:hypothetical protein ACI2KR_08605 [Pseudomonas luteola]